MDSVLDPLRAAALATARKHLEDACTATKCHGCGCFQNTVAALEHSGIADLHPVLEGARRVFVAKKYDCLGCEVCFPAVAANALAEAFHDAIADTALCPTDNPTERSGWPPLPGDYFVVRYGAAVAVCTLNNEVLAKKLADSAPDGLAIAGTMHTENLGIERLIRNVLSNPNIRFLVVCGDDTKQLVGHLPGQSIESLFTHGIDDRQRIIGANGKRAFLKNVSGEHVSMFTRNVELVSMIGEEDLDRIRATITDCHAKARPPSSEYVIETPVETLRAKEPQFHRSDPAGFFVVYPDHRAKELVVEHYSNAGVLDCVVQGATPTALYAEIIARGLVSQLDHAAYLGRELAVAERSLRTGEPYVQDRAPGEAVDESGPVNCAPSCKSCP